MGYVVCRERRCWPRGYETPTNNFAPRPSAPLGYLYRVYYTACTQGKNTSIICAGLEVWMGVKWLLHSTAGPANATHLYSHCELYKGTCGLIGACSAGKHMTAVDALEDADEIGTFCLVRSERCKRRQGFTWTLLVSPGFPLGKSESPSLSSGFRPNDISKHPILNSLHSRCWLSKFFKILDYLGAFLSCLSIFWLLNLLRYTVRQDNIGLLLPVVHLFACPGD